MELKEDRHQDNWLPLKRSSSGKMAIDRDRRVRREGRRGGERKEGEGGRRERRKREKRRKVGKLREEVRVNKGRSKEYMGEGEEVGGEGMREIIISKFNVPFLKCRYSHMSNLKYLQQDPSRQRRTCYTLQTISEVPLLTPVQLTTA